jgi:outer membrane usher protein
MRIPYRSDAGPLVRADFKTSTGIRALVTVLHNGKPLLFGTTVTTSDGASSGIVGESGEVYLAGLASQGELQPAGEEVVTSTAP